MPPLFAKFSADAILANLCTRLGLNHYLQGLSNFMPSTGRITVLETLAQQLAKSAHADTRLSVALGLKGILEM